MSGSPVFDRRAGRRDGKPERRRVPRGPVPRVTTSLMGSEAWTLELAPPQAIARLAAPMDDLAERALEANVFADPLVLGAAWPRLTSRLAPGGVFHACLWRHDGEARCLQLAVPLQRERGRFSGGARVRTTSNHFLPLGTPLVDRADPEGAFATFLRLCADPRLGLPPVMAFAHQRADGPAAAALRAACDGLGLPHAGLHAHSRGQLRPVAGDGSGDGPDDPLRTLLGRKAHRELNRLRRRLAERGAVETTFCGGPTPAEREAALDAFEAFLTLEAASWKGRRGTALHNDRAIVAFSREIVARMAAKGRARVLLIRLDGRPVAGLVMLSRAGQGVAWKTAFDADLARYAPGVQAFCEMSRALLAEPGFVAADSLAVPDHPMVNRLWRDRLAIADIAVGLTQASGPAVERFVAAQERNRRWRDRLRDAALRTGLMRKGHAGG